MPVTADQQPASVRVGRVPARAPAPADEAVRHSVLEAAREYLRRGWRPTPVKYQGKQPILKGWQKRHVNEDQLHVHFGRRPVNVGVLLGEASGGLLDVDLDCAEAIGMADALLPLTACVFGRAGKPRSHRLYICQPPPATVRHKYANATLVELRGDGAQTVLPPSIHESGEPIEWDGCGESSVVERTALARAVALLAVACVLAREWPQAPGSRQEIALAVGGGLLRSGCSPDEAARVVEAVARYARDEEADKRADAVRRSAEKVQADDATTGWPTAAEFIGLYAVSQVRKLLNDFQSGSASRVGVVGPADCTHDTQDAQDAQTPTDAQGCTGSAMAEGVPPPLRDGTTTARVQTVEADIKAKRPGSLPLAEHVAAALEMHWRWKVHGQPPREHWTTTTWGLVRTLKGHPGMSNMSGGEALRALESIIAVWPHPTDEPPLAFWTGLPIVEARAEIAFAWDSVVYAAGFGPLDAALAYAKRSPLQLRLEDYRGDEYAEFISTLGWLQVLAGEKDIYVSCRSFGKLHGVGHTTVWLWRCDAVRQGYMNPGARSTGFEHADEFHFVIDRFPALVSAAEKRAKNPRFSS